MAKKGFFSAEAVISCFAVIILMSNFLSFGAVDYSVLLSQIKAHDLLAVWLLTDPGLEEMVSDSVSFFGDSDFELLINGRKIFGSPGSEMIYSEILIVDGISAKRISIGYPKNHRPALFGEPN